ncbi:class I adenylate-forming enzyme family protein [Nocardiopsis sp. LOL_012]|uniref:class I adenylate-forming enzyme family protein n=1 Tax=Nocardiopsis sp. LOL_012 TaxID=3345409 RepID=UPI003A88F71D
MSEQETLGAVFLDACRRHAGRRAVVDGETSLTYTDFAERVLDRVSVLDGLLDPSVRSVALYAANSVEYLVSYYALVVSGRVPFLVDPQFGAAELTGIREGCGVEAFVVGSGNGFPLDADTHPLGESGQTLALPARGSEPRHERVEPGRTTATCRFTSGTTGAPKCLEFSHTAVVTAARNWVKGTALGADDRVLCLAAFSNGLAFNTSLLPVFLTGAELHVHRGMPTSGTVVRAVRRSGATRLVAFPFVYGLLADARVDEALSALTMAVSAAAVLDPRVRGEFESRHGVRIADYYGIAEVGPCTFERDPAFPSGLGTPLPGVSLRLSEVGGGGTEIRVRTASMASGYLNAPGELEARTDGDGYYRTGDLGHVTDGRLYVTGRLAGPINAAGRKIDPAEIERVALTLDGAHDAAAFADTDANGNTIVHLVLAAPDHVGRAAVTEVCRRNLAPYKVPSRVSVLPAIPRSSSGKPRFAELKQQVSKQEGTE